MSNPMWCAVCGEWTDHRSGKHTDDYRKVAFVEMVHEAKRHLSGKCPLIEDEATVWAWEEIQRLKAAIEKTLLENGHLADGENCTLIELKRAIRAE